MDPSLLEMYIKVHTNWKYAWLRPTMDQIWERYEEKYGAGLPKEEDEEDVKELTALAKVDKRTSGTDEFVDMTADAMEIEVIGDKEGIPPPPKHIPRNENTCTYPGCTMTSPPIGDCCESRTATKCGNKVHHACINFCHEYKDETTRDDMAKQHCYPCAIKKGLLNAI